MTTETIISAILANQEQWVAAAIAEERESYDQNKIGEVKVDVVRAMKPEVYRRRDGTIKRYPDNAFEVTEVLPDIGSSTGFRVTVERISDIRESTATAHHHHLMG